MGGAERCLRSDLLEPVSGPTRPHVCGNATIRLCDSRQIGAEDNFCVGDDAHGMMLAVVGRVLVRRIAHENRKGYIVDAPRAKPESNADTKGHKR